jgi:hypothetical protein
VKCIIIKNNILGQDEEIINDEEMTKYLKKRTKLNKDGTGGYTYAEIARMIVETGHDNLTLIAKEFHVSYQVVKNLSEICYHIDTEWLWEDELNQF